MRAAGLEPAQQSDALKDIRNKSQPLTDKMRKPSNAVI
ncbi:hypothetical protein FH063_004617 [Azospirillum argentinense]|uniref:Uncharacterized protein n=1 Tax=Azospirillum argentinense TaxID=2970906 RepID=A0A5B0KWM8_9PROT|nr:hypothetical protein FH063_004617 [Azospirillum argentinense]